MANNVLPLQNVLQSLASNPEDLMVTLLLDCSRSMERNFTNLQKSASLLVDAFRGSLIQIIAFSTFASQLSVFTVKTDVLHSLIQGMDFKKLTGSTNMCTAFAAAYESITRNITADSKNFILLITDGEPTDNPTEQINQIRNLNPKPEIIGIAVGDSSFSKLTNILQPNSVYRSDDFVKLNEELKKLKNSFSATEPWFIIRFLPTGFIQRSTEDLKLQIELCPVANQEILKDTSLTILKSNFYHAASHRVSKTLVDNEEYKFDVELKITTEGVRKDGKFPEKIFYIVQEPNGRRCKGYFSVDLFWFSGDFLCPDDLRYLAQEPLNILVWGPMGAGKSSFVNGCINLFTSNTKFQFFETVLQKPTHVTTSYKCIDIANKLNPLNQNEHQISEELKMCLWDIWGITQQNHKSMKIEKFIKGSVAKNVSMESIACSYSQDEARENMIHCVICILPIGTAMDPTMLDIIAEQMETARRNSIPVILVLTMAGQLEKEAEKSAALTEITKKLGLAVTPYLIDNYSEEGKKCPEKDIQYKIILQCAFESALGTLKSIFEQKEARFKTLSVQFIGDEEKKDSISITKKGKISSIKEILRFKFGLGAAASLSDFVLTDKDFNPLNEESTIETLKTTEIKMCHKTLVKPSTSTLPDSQLSPPPSPRPPSSKMITVVYGEKSLKFNCTNSMTFMELLKEAFDEWEIPEPDQKNYSLYYNDCKIVREQFKDSISEVDANKFELRFRPQSALVTPPNSAPGTPSKPAKHMFYLKKGHERRGYLTSPTATIGTVCKDIKNMFGIEESVNFFISQSNDNLGSEHVYVKVGKEISTEVFQIAESEEIRQYIQPNSDILII